MLLFCFFDINYNLLFFSINWIRELVYILKRRIYHYLLIWNFTTSQVWCLVDNNHLNLKTNYFLFAKKLSLNKKTPDIIFCFRHELIMRENKFCKIWQYFMGNIFIRCTLLKLKGIWRNFTCHNFYLRTNFLFRVLCNFNCEYGWILSDLIWKNTNDFNIISPNFFKFWNLYHSSSWINRDKIIRRIKGKASA